MATENYQEQHEQLRKLISNEMKVDHTEIEAEELLDVEEETEHELDFTPFDFTETKKGFGVKLPTGDTVVTWNRDGTPRNYYRDPQWTLCVGSDEETISFGSVHHEFGLDLSSELCIPLVYFHKLNTFFYLPGNDPTRNISSCNTTKGAYYQLLHLCSLLKDNSYLFGKGNDFIGLSTLSVDTIRNELIKGIEQDDFTRVSRLASTITPWINISQLACFPPEYAAPFTAKQVWADGLKEKIVRYLATKKKPYDVIEFDDLVQMFKRAKKFLDNYIDDVLFIGSIFDQMLCKDAPRNSQGGMLTLIPSGHTKEMVKAISTRKFVIDPDTGDACVNRL